MRFIDISGRAYYKLTWTPWTEGKDRDREGGDSGVALSAFASVHHGETQRGKA